MKQAFAVDFAQHWIEAWNAHNLDRILSHYADDFEMSSPMIQTLGLSESGTLKGKVAVGHYWRKALDNLPDLHFELLTLLVGVDTLSLHYKSTLGHQVVEVFHFNAAGCVDGAQAHYAV